MTEAVWVALITLAGTVITVLASAAAERGKNKKELEQQLQAFKRASDANDADIKKQIEAVGVKLDKHIRDEEINDIKQRRVRIIRAADDIAGGRQPSKDYIEDIIEDIDNYETYCSSHPEYHNGKGRMAMKCVTNYYKSEIMGVNEK